jgi:sialic acid synthase SpsE
MKECALGEEEEMELKNYVESKGMIYLSTPFSRAAADRLEKMGVCAYKIGSGEMNNIPLIRHIAEFKKPMIISTGMNDIKSIEVTVALLKDYNIEYALLHTTNLYPTPPSLVRLGAMTQIRDAFKDVVFGLSDHTVNNNACVAAIAQGASIVERHFTDHKNRIGPDIVCSMDERDLMALIQSSKEIHAMLGGEKGALKEEQDTINFAFATVVSINNIKKGEPFTKQNIWVKRPGCGEIPASEYDNLLGALAAEDISADIHLRRSMVEKISDA